VCQHGPELPNLRTRGVSNLTSARIGVLRGGCRVAGWYGAIEYAASNQWDG
jgi:hypothetical protein